uniref:Uncharacterized protein n=1 Tax=Enterovibrio norvegicus TaxID=188144 RepID=A0A0H4A1Z5_9GAMM|nr:hypothetical protein [Enterovibrio norvegicus]
MVLGSLAPFFLLIGIKGSDLVSDTILWSICLMLVSFPNLFLLLRIYSSKKHKDKKAFKVVSVSDNREHLLVYLFFVLVPLFQANMNVERELIMIIFVSFFVVFLFLSFKSSLYEFFLCYF